MTSDEFLIGNLSGIKSFCAKVFGMLECALCVSACVICWCVSQSVCKVCECVHVVCECVCVCGEGGPMSESLYDFALRMGRGAHGLYI